MFDQKLATADELFFVAIADEQVAGTAMAGFDGHRGWLYRVAVAPELRRQGIATSLIRHCEQALARRGCLKVNLQVRAPGPEAVRFYQACGYSLEERVSMGRQL